MNFMHIFPMIRKHGHSAFLDKVEYLALHIVGCLNQDIGTRLCCPGESLIHGHLTDGPRNITARLVFDML